VMKMYPNPTTGTINIQISQYVGKVNIQVNDLTGKVIFALKGVDFNSNKALDLSSLARGIYIVTVKGDDLNYVEKVIVN
jgi:hypothetical protein